MSEKPNPRCAMHRVSPSEWVVNDRRYPPGDARHTVARVYELAPTELEVVWLRDLPLAISYDSAEALLSDVERLLSVSRATRPVPIPHLPPPTPARRRFL